MLAKTRVQKIIIRLKIIVSNALKDVNHVKTKTNAVNVTTDSISTTDLALEAANLGSMLIVFPEIADPVTNLVRNVLKPQINLASSVELIILQVKNHV